MSPGSAESIASVAPEIAGFRAIRIDNRQEGPIRFTLEKTAAPGKQPDLDWLFED